jgi:flotillin
LLKYEISLANQSGNIGAKECDAATRQQIAILEAETIAKENEMKQKIELSNAEVAVTQSIANQKKEIAKIESINNARMVETQMQQEVEQKRIIMETEKLRATAMSKSCVEAEALIKKSLGEQESTQIKAEADLIARQKSADAVLYTKQKESDALLYSNQKESESIKILAEANLYSNQKVAEVELYTKQKEADAILAICDSQSTGMTKLLNTFNNDVNSMVQYLMIEKDLYEKLAKTNSEALKNLNPKITVWNTNSGKNEDSTGYTNVISDVMKMLPPLLSTIHEQTGIKPSDNLINMPKLKNNE